MRFTIQNNSLVKRLHWDWINLKLNTIVGVQSLTDILIPNSDLYSLAEKWYPTDCFENISAFPTPLY